MLSFIDGRQMLSRRGQATVEAAFLIPVLLLLILLLCQPAILLYNQIVMQNAAAESCRLLATRSDVGSYSDQKYEAYTLRRLAAIPPVDVFHAHGNGMDWQIDLVGGELSQTVSVRIQNHLKPLPIIAWGAGVLRQTDQNGYLTQSVEVTMPSQPDWVFKLGGDPQTWVKQWD
ncbi:MAG: pilus assembly protein [Actinomycetia bacterium]|nr:pilus assembly protein [Actinomycetes bacterium]